MGFPYDTSDWSGIFAEGASGVCLPDGAAARQAGIH